MLHTNVCFWVGWTMMKMMMKIEGWPTLLKERNWRVNKWWRIDRAALMVEMKLSDGGDCLIHTQTPKILVEWKLCVCIYQPACVSLVLDFQQGEFGCSGRTFYFHFKKFSKTNSRMLAQPLIAVTCMERCLLFYKDLLYWTSVFGSLSYCD